jgi:hypothetical protein
VAAIREALVSRPTPKDEANAGLAFITRCGAAWVSVKLVMENEPSDEGSNKKRMVVKTGDSIGQEMTRVLKRTSLRQAGKNFYALRHTLETIGGEARDQVAVDAIMGHVDESMAAVYREGISDERLKAVTDHVRGWLFDGAVLGNCERI